MQKPDLRLIKTYHHSLQVKHHLEVKINQKNNNPELNHESKGKRCRPRNTQPNPNTQGPPPAKKDNLKKPTT